MLAWKQYIIIGFITIFIFFAFLVSKDAKPANQTQTAPSVANQQQEKKQDYEIITKQDSSLFILVNSTPSEEEAEKLSKTINKDECNNKCNLVQLYDDKKAAELDAQYSRLTSSDEMTNWKKENYVYVGDHCIGYLFQDGFSYYPLKDWYYEELKSAQ